MLSVLQDMNRIEEDREAEEDGPQDSQLNSTQNLHSHMINPVDETNPLHGVSYTNFVKEIVPPVKSNSRLSSKTKKSSKAPKLGKKEKEER